MAAIMISGEIYPYNSIVFFATQEGMTYIVVKLPVPVPCKSQTCNQTIW